ncbi:MAG: hypothetical protein WC055_00790 [Melioribacteraceae bacterium]
MKINKHIGKTDKCPECGFDFRGEDIYECFLKKGKSEQEAFEIASACYGYSWKNKKCFRKEIAIETIGGGYDGATFYHCPECKVYWKRFEWSNELSLLNKF